MDLDEVLQLRARVDVAHLPAQHLQGLAPVMAQVQGTKRTLPAVEKCSIFRLCILYLAHHVALQAAGGLNPGLTLSSTKDSGHATGARTSMQPRISHTV